MSRELVDYTCYLILLQKCYTEVYQTQKQSLLHPQWPNLIATKEGHKDLGTMQQINFEITLVFKVQEKEKERKKQYAPKRLQL